MLQPDPFRLRVRSIAVTLVVAASLAAQSDPLAADFRRWFRGDLARDRDLTTRVLNRLRKRARVEDGRRLLRVIARTPKSKGERRVRDDLLRNLAGRGTKLGIQTAFFEWLVRDKIVRGDAAVAAWSHKNPAMAARILPLFGAFHKTRYRKALECFARSDDPTLYMAAADGLWRTGTDSAMRALVRLLNRERDLPRTRTIASWLQRLVANRDGQLTPALRGLISSVVCSRMRTAADLEWKRATLPLLNQLRARESVPALIGELENAVVRYRSPRKPVSTRISFWIADVHDALRDLTGFSARPRPEIWRDFWEREKERFRVWPLERAIASRRLRPKGFYGIRVRGLRVLFLLDASGSMKRRLTTKGKPSRFTSAKSELLRVLGGFDADASFNVLLFADEVLSFKPGPVKAKPWRLKKFRTWLSNMRMGDETNLQFALQAGLEGRVFRTHNKFRWSVDEVFVVSDGLPRQNPKRLLRNVDEWNTGKSCRIHTVCLGPGDGHERNPLNYPTGGGPGIDFLRTLAERNGGEFKIVR